MAAVTGDGSEAVRAAGGVVWRTAPGGEVEVLVVHRPKYDDWSLPKGKLHPGEGGPEAALREVEEETGLKCALGPELASSTYRDGRDRPKVVRYWAMVPTGGTFRENTEVDDVRWVRMPEAANVLTYDRDREVVASLDLPSTRLPSGRADPPRPPRQGR